MVAHSKLRVLSFSDLGNLSAMIVKVQSFFKTAIKGFMLRMLRETSTLPGKAKYFPGLKQNKPISKLSGKSVGSMNWSSKTMRDWWLNHTITKG